MDSNGNDIESGIGILNPFRYRGYYYDTETELYYLQTRYYDPEVGRFISRDSIEYADPEAINGLNLYAYCGNNPVMYIDTDGHSLLLFIVAAVIGFTVSFTASAVTQAVLNDGKVNWGTAAIDGLFGALSSIVFAIPGIGPVATGLINTGLTFANMVITTGIENDWQYSIGDWITIGVSSILSGVVSGYARYNFFANKGKEILKDAHSQVGNIIKRLGNGHYFISGSMKVAQKSIRSAVQHIFKTIVSLNFGKGFWKDWLITLLSSIFAGSLSKGINRLR